MDLPLSPTINQGTHAHPSNATTQSTNYRQIGTRKGNGRLLLGAAHSYHASSVAAVSGTTDAAGILAGSVPSIPSRFETVLYAGDQEPDAFNSRCSRFKPVALDLPGPGSYLSDVVASNPAIKSNSTSYSVKGYGNGFVSKSQRFKRRGGGPGPGQYATHTVNTLAERASSAPSGKRGASLGTAAFRSPQSAALDPRLSSEVKQQNQPGPGAYATTKTVILTAAEERKRAAKQAGLIGRSPSASALAAAIQQTVGASILSPLCSPPQEPAFNSRDVRFRAHESPDVRLGAGPAGYNPNVNAIKPASSSYVGLFKSQTHRTDFTANRAEVPGPGSYQSEEKVNADDLHHPVSPTRPFKQTGIDRFGHVIEPRVAREELPGPGQYSPFVPGARSDSPLRGGPASFNRIHPKHPTPSPTSPLAASLSHGLPLTKTPTASSPEARLTANNSSIKRKKRAAGVGGPGKSLLATRGGPGVVLNSPKLLLHPTSSGTFGRAGLTQQQPTPSVVAQAITANQPALVSKESDIRPPGPAFYNPAAAFHSAKDKKDFHLNTESRWM